MSELTHAQLAAIAACPVCRSLDVTGMWRGREDRPSWTVCQEHREQTPRPASRAEGGV